MTFQTLEKLQTDLNLIMSSAKTYVLPLEETKSVGVLVVPVFFGGLLE